MSLYKIAFQQPSIRTSLLLLLSFLLVKCGQGSTKTESSVDSIETTTATRVTLPDTLCFRQVIGRDSTTLQLVIRDSTVTGELNVLPFEKDRAQGPVHGTLRKNQIIADWQRSGEGVTQLYDVVFTLKGDAVSWREGERIEKQGKWVLTNPEQGYTYVLTKAECK